jgi:hypothetical protein
MPVRQASPAFFFGFFAIGAPLRRTLPRCGERCHHDCSASIAFQRARAASAASLNDLARAVQVLSGITGKRLTYCATGS